jgi:putative SOS response-associated peptidase YedK
MCGRYTLTSPAQAIADVFGLDTAEVDALEASAPRHNIAPGQDVWIVRADRAGVERELRLVRWGLVPSWADSPAPAATMINARVETVAEKPAFRKAFQRRRCIVPADGFYEWQRRSGGSQPFWIGGRDHRPFGMAGLWEIWRGAGDARIESCTILTTAPNDLVAPLHDRMPVILAPDDFAVWLDPRETDVERLRSVLRTAPSDALVMHPVSTRVNDPRNDDPDCSTPVTPASDPQGSLF